MGVMGIPFFHQMEDLFHMVIKALVLLFNTLETAQDVLERITLFSPLSRPGGFPGDMFGLLEVLVHHACQLFKMVFGRFEFRFGVGTGGHELSIAHGSFEHDGLFQLLRLNLGHLFGQRHVLFGHSLDLGADGPHFCNSIAADDHHDGQ